jgi:REP-associated tyrosine transposase
MPRKPRFFVPGFPAHIVQRGHNRQFIFFEDIDYQLYLSLLAEARERYPCEIHAYVLMSNHVHILATPSERDSISRMMQHVGRHYVPYINARYGRSGTLFEGRFRATIIETSEYLLACYRYIELNPVRAAMVRFPGDYPWSSFLGNVNSKDDGLITGHAEYQNLGGSPAERAQNYRMLFDDRLADYELEAIRIYTQSGTPLGDAKFAQEVEAVLAVETGQPMRGRPWVGH